MLRRIFITGLAAIMPLGITLLVIIWLFNFTSKILGTYLGNFINKFLYRHLGYTFPWLGVLLGVIISVLIIFCIGLLLRLSKMRILRFFERLLLKLPLVKDIYFPLKKVVDLLFGERPSQFKGVVLVEYPRKGIYSIGFITNKSSDYFIDKTNKKVYTVFVPLSPTPFSGFTIVVPQEDITFLDISVEEAVKVIVSGGMVNPNEKIQ